MNIKLVYFDLRWRAEFIRMMFEAVGEKYEEERIQLQDWPKVKPTTPYGALPYIVYNGKTYGQSGAIATFVARELGFYGKTNLDGLRIDEIHGLFEDLAQRNLVKSRWAEGDDAKAEFRRKAIEEDAPEFFGYFERMLKENGGNGFAVGNALTLGDFYIYEAQNNFLDLKPDVLKDFPLNQKLRQNVEAHPKLKAYFARRKKTIM